MALFRLHRGGLDESLKTTVIVRDFVDLVNAITKICEGWPTMNTSFSYKYEPYPMENNFDARIGWYTQLVCADIYDKGVFVPVGYLSEPI